MQIEITQAIFKGRRSRRAHEKFTLDGDGTLSVASIASETAACSQCIHILRFVLGNLIEKRIGLGN
jgi:hypothetical protein